MSSSGWINRNVIQGFLSVSVELPFSTSKDLCWTWENNPMYDITLFFFFPHFWVFPYSSPAFLHFCLIAIKPHHLRKLKSKLLFAPTVPLSIFWTGILLIVLDY